ncbi:MAG: signal peptidase II [Deltaproteobacteria bacterium]|nr:signal peptidase II [Deltaproteobacteria bacterium]
MTLTTSDSHADAPAVPALQPRSPRLVIACALLALAVLTIDLATKEWARTTLSDARLGAAPALCDDTNGPRRPQRIAHAPRPVAGEVLSLDYAENCSAAFGLARQLPAPARRIFLASMAILAVVALFVALARGHGSWAFVWGVPLVAAGALGNMIDRLRLGYVVDFLHVHYAPWDFDYPVFNVADIVIGIGVALLVIGAIRTPADDPEPESNARPLT